MLNPDDPFETLTDWDYLLQEMRVARDKMHRRRKWKTRGLKHAAGWCRWAARDWEKLSRKTIKDLDGGSECKRTPIDEEGEGPVWEIKPGCFRKKMRAAEKGHTVDAASEREIEGMESLRQTENKAEYHVTWENDAG